LKGAKLCIWTGAILASFCDIVLLAYNEISGQPLLHVGELFSKLGIERVTFNRANNRHLISAERYDADDILLHKRNAAQYPVHVALIRTLESLQVEPTVWAQISAAKKLRNEFAHETLPMTQWKACVGAFCDDRNLGSEAKEALLAATEHAMNYPCYIFRGNGQNKFECATHQKNKYIQVCIK
jgi:hypothetical protein